MAQAPKKQPIKRPAGDYVACIYVHGMGSQRRFEETCRLIDGIDQLVGSELGDDGKPARMLAGIRAKIEVPRQADDADVAFIRAQMVEGNDWSRTVRFHELYWAPVMAGQRSAIGIAKWMLRQIVRPLSTSRAPWRERPRLRRAALTAMFEGKPVPARDAENDYADLMSLYDAYENLESKRAYETGDFDGFLALIGDTYGLSAERTARLTAIAHAWSARYQRDEWRNVFLLITVALTMLLGVLAVVTVAGMAIAFLGGVLQARGLDAVANLLPETSWPTLIPVVVSMILSFGAGKFLTDYMGDVQAWATFEETDEKFERRAKVIATGERIFRQVLEDDACKRVVVIAHSLGTSVAHDVLFALTRHNKARNTDGHTIGNPLNLKKIEHFVTMGSPIDKIEYFFESFVTQSHRFLRFRDEMRGDIGTVPFTTDSKDPHIHWINFWDDADLISGALHSPGNASGRRQHVDNVHVQTLRFPSPGRAHGAYFEDRRVIDCVTQILFKNEWSFPRLPLVDRSPDPDQSRDYASAYLASKAAFSDPPGQRRVWHWLAITLPWLAIIAAIVTFVFPEFAYFAAAAPVLLGLLLAVGYWWLGTRPVIHPIPQRKRARLNRNDEPNLK